METKLRPKNGDMKKEECRKMDSKDFVYMVKTHRDKHKSRQKTFTISDAGRKKLKEVMKRIKVKREDMSGSLMIECILWLFAQNIGLGIEELLNKKWLETVSK